MSNNEKIQKVLARAGYGSRRQIEEWIKAGDVKVNNRVATIGERVTLSDKLFLHNKPCKIETVEKTRVIMYNKPLGEICTRSDPEGRPTVFKNLPPIQNARWINVGRLDINTTGLILFTNDGELVNQLTHPSNQVEREYMVRVIGDVNADVLKNLTQGVKLEDGMARFEEVVESRHTGANRWFYVVTVEGRNRIVRRLFESQNITVNRLKRLRFGPVNLPKSLREGSWMEVDPSILRKSDGE